jgi:hypothetical protein
MALFSVELAHGLCNRVHGSGLDCDPEITESRRNVVVRWAFHMMDDNGFYRGWWRFTVFVPKNNPFGFRVVGRRGNARIEAACGMKEHLEETLYMGMEEELFAARLYAPANDAYFAYSKRLRKEAAHGGD